MSLLFVERLSKRYGDFSALSDVSLEAFGGEIFGLLGPNGAGKTTLLRLLATLLKPSDGRVLVGGKDTVTEAETVRRMVGVVNGGMGLPARLTGREILRSFADFYDLALEAADAKIADLDEQLGLGRTLDVRAGEYSTGMRQKVVIARALIHDPKVLILDEAASGLDIFARRNLLDFVAASRGSDRLTLYSTHVMSEAEEVCDRVAILHAGRLLAVDHLTHILEKTGEKTLERAFFKLVTEKKEGK